MEVIITDSSASQAHIVADLVQTTIATSVAPVIGLATGSSPLATYAELARRHQQGLSFSNVSMFLLDEYVGLPSYHREAYINFIRRNLTSLIDVPSDRVLGPDGTATDLEAACNHYEQAIRDAGGVDLQLLGIGADGHIGFNEPSSSLGSRTRVKTLTQQTRADNARFFMGDLDAVPRHVLTQGIGTILSARHLVLIAQGQAKARPVADAVEGPVSAMVPASALQLHPRVTVVVDEAAASDLTLGSYYRDTYAAKVELEGTARAAR